MTKPINIPNVFASATSAIPLSQLDQDFSTLANATNDLATYSNYVADTGAANSFITNYPSNTNTNSLTTGLRLQFKAANANTGASTLNVQVNGSSIGTAAIRLTDGSALPANTIISGAIVDVMYDGTNFQLMNDPSGGQEVITNLSLSGNLTVAGTSTFTGNVTGNVVNTTTSTITNLSSSNVTITGGTISNVTLDNVTVDVETFSNITINGTASFADGTVSAPSITNTGDTNTGIYFPAEDTIAFTEGGVESGRFTSTGALQLNNNLTFSGTGNRITGDFSNATVANRVLAQSSTTNGNTNFGLIPNGTSSISAFRAYNNSDPTNASEANLSVVTTTDVRLQSTITGTGTYLPLTMYTGGSERLRIDTSGNLLLGTSTSFTSTGLAGALKMDGYGVYPYLNTSGATNTAVVGGLVYQNSTPYSGDNGATSTTMVAALVQARLSNSGAGGTNSINMQSGNFGIVISNVGSAARIGAIGVNGAAVRNISTDVSTDASNALTGVSGSVSHGITAGAGIVSGTALAGTFSAANTNGTTTTIEGVRAGVNIANSTSSLSASSTNATGIRAVLNVGSTSGGPGTVTNLFGLVTQGPTIGATGTVTNYYGLYLDTANVTGTLTNRYGVWQNDASSINYFAGNVGIGTTAPATKLQVSASGGYVESRVSSGTNDVGLAIDGSSAYLAVFDSIPLTFQTNSTERMRIGSTGLVGIGTTNPGVQFQVNSTTEWGVTLRAASNTTTFRALYLTQRALGSLSSPTAVTSGTIIGGIESGAYNGTDYTFGFNGGGSIQIQAEGTWTTSSNPTNIQFFTNAVGNSGYTERMRIDSSGNVGIGTSSPSSKLTVASSNVTVNAGYGIAFSGDQNRIMTPEDNVSGALIRWASGGICRFLNGSTENMRIDASGNLSVGTTTALGRVTIYTGGDGYASQVVSNNGFSNFIGRNAAGTPTFFVSGAGAVTKASGTFRIEHPIPEKAVTHDLVHSFIEGPNADLIYRGKAVLVNGKASVNIDTESRMTDGTFVLLCRNVQCFTTNETDWTAIKGSVTGNILNIEAQDESSTAEISWMVIGERQDKHMYETNWTDENGRPIVEPLKSK